MITNMKFIRIMHIIPSYLLDRLGKVSIFPVAIARLSKYSGFVFTRA